MDPTFSISIVSHGHKHYVAELIEDLVRLGRPDIEVILTLNFPESLPFDTNALPFPAQVITNAECKGFAANHNASFSVSRGKNFVILNPDIRLQDDPFDALLALLKVNPDSICAPLIVNEKLEVEDSARCFPTPFFLLNKLVRKIFNLSSPSESLVAKERVLMPDWVAGMFIVVPRTIYTRLHGLDERYHMYYEDVDLCARARLAGYEILLSREAKAIHNAQRDSHRKLRYLAWHIRSAFRFFTSAAYLRIRLSRLF